MLNKNIAIQEFINKVICVMYERKHWTLCYVVILCHMLNKNIAIQKIKKIKSFF